LKWCRKSPAMSLRLSPNNLVCQGDEHEISNFIR
jgi:hypothetical protein